MLAGTDDHFTWLSPIILNLESMGLTHLESEIRVFENARKNYFVKFLKNTILAFVCVLAI